MRLSMAPRTGWALALLAAGFALLFGSVLGDLFHLWWQDPNYSHGLLIPLVSGFFVWRKRQELMQAAVTPHWAGAVVVLAGIVLLAFGMGVDVVGAGPAGLFVRGFAVVATLAGVLLFLLGWAHVRLLVLPLTYLLFMLPLPGKLFTAITVPLQAYATTMTTLVLRLWHIPVFREGNVITLPSMTLGVVEACSGIRSLFSLLALAVAMALVFIPGDRAWRRFLFAASAVPIAILTNAFRVIVTGLAAHAWGPQVATGFYHDFSGWIVFLAAFALLSIELTALTRRTADNAE